VTKVGETMSETSSASNPIAEKDYYSTSEVAVLCRVHKNTIIAAINRGLLPASKTPGGHNRVSKADLAQFMRERGIPEVFETVSSVTRILVCAEDANTVKRVRRSLPSPQYDVLAAPTLLEAGAACARQSPDVVVLPADRTGDEWAKLPADIREIPECRRTRLLGLADDGAGDRQGFDRVIAREARPGEILDAIGELIQ
jgi:excisionase family DNA binding protein